MGLLKSIWNGFGDMYDSVGNNSENDYDNENLYSTKVRVIWRGKYLNSTGQWCWGIVDEVIPYDMYKRLDKNAWDTTCFIKNTINDCQDLESDYNTLSLVEYV